MSKVVDQNPESESRVIGNGSILTATLFKHLALQGFTLRTLEKMCPVWGDEIVFVGEVFNQPVYLSGNGRIHV